MWWRRMRHAGSKPAGYTELDYNELPFLTNYQDKWVYPWYNVPAHEQRSALVNCWTGNQLPGEVNFVPGVEQSKYLWNYPTFYMNTPSGQGFNIGNVQYNVGKNIQTSSSMQAANWQKQAYLAWLNRAGPTV